MDKSLSIIFTVYNKEDYVKRSLECLYDALSLVDVPYEVIIVEDCSTDSSYEIIKEYGERPFTTLLRNDTNKGHFQTKCRGFLNATNTWILTIDGDDYVDKGYIKELMDAIDEDTYVLIARNNRVNRTVITDATVYWSIHNLPFILFRREFIVKNIDYYKAELPRSAWDDCTIIVPIYCQVTDMLKNGNVNALKHYHNTYRYNVNYTHSNTEIREIAAITIRDGVQLMKHLSDWCISHGYMDKYYQRLLGVLTQYLTVFRFDVRYMRPFVSEIHPRKDDSIVVIYEYTDHTKTLKDYKQINSQTLFINDMYFSLSFTDTLKYLYLTGKINNRPVLRLCGDCNIHISFIEKIVELVKDNTFSFDCAGYVYKHKGIRYIDYSRPVLYGTTMIEKLVNISSPVVIQEAIRLRADIKTVPLNDLYDSYIVCKSRLNHSLTYIPKVFSKLHKPMKHLIDKSIAYRNLSDLPVYYIIDPSIAEEEHNKRVVEIKAALSMDIKPVTFEELKIESEHRKGYALICSYSMDTDCMVKFVGTFWQLSFDNVPVNAVGKSDCIIKQPDRRKVYAKINEPINVLTDGGIVNFSCINDQLNTLINDVYKAL